MHKLGVILAVIFLVQSCGQPPESAPPSPPAAQPPASTSPSWAEVAQVITKDCGACHNGTKEPAFPSGDAFKSSTAKSKLLSGAMPPGGAISQQDKNLLLAYLDH